MVELVFVHGWGFGPTVWDGVRNHFTDFQTSCLDLGFFGEPNTEIKGQNIVFVTHSMGLSWLLNNYNGPIKGLVSINGFTKFCRGANWPDAIAPIMLRRMIKQFEKDPETVWHDFMVKSGHDNPLYPKGANEERLLLGLRNLMDGDVREAFISCPCPKLVLASRQDLIVPESLSKSSFGSQLEWYDQANHLLPLSHASSISARIRSFVEKLS